MQKIKKGTRDIEVYSLDVAVTPSPHPNQDPIAKIAGFYQKLVASVRLFDRKALICKELFQKVSWKQKLLPQKLYRLNIGILREVQLNRIVI